VQQVNTSALEIHPTPPKKYNNNRLPMSAGCRSPFIVLSPSCRPSPMPALPPGSSPPAGCSPLNTNHTAVPLTTPDQISKIMERACVGTRLLGSQHQVCSATELPFTLISRAILVTPYPDSPYTTMSMRLKGQFQVAWMMHSAC